MDAATANRIFIPQLAHVQPGVFGAVVTHCDPRDVQKRLTHSTDSLSVALRYAWEQDVKLLHDRLMGWHAQTCQIAGTYGLENPTYSKRMIELCSLLLPFFRQLTKATPAHVVSAVVAHDIMPFWHLAKPSEKSTRMVSWLRTDNLLQQFAKKYPVQSEYF